MFGRIFASCFLSARWFEIPEILDADWDLHFNISQFLNEFLAVNLFLPFFQLLLFHLSSVFPCFPLWCQCARAGCWAELLPSPWRCSCVVLSATRWWWRRALIKPLDLRFIRLRSWCFTWRHLATPNLVAWMLQERVLHVVTLDDVSARFLGMWLCICNTDPLIMDSWLKTLALCNIRRNTGVAKRCPFSWWYAHSLHFKGHLTFLRNLWQFFSQVSTLRECCRLPLVGYYGPDDSPLVAPAGKNNWENDLKNFGPPWIHRESDTVRWVMETCIQKAQWVESWPRSQHF